jgi:hypothetical protein
MKEHCHYWPGETQDLPPKAENFHQNKICFFFFFLNISHCHPTSNTDKKTPLHLKGEPNSSTQPN